MFFGGAGAAGGWSGQGGTGTTSCARTRSSAAPTAGTTTSWGRSTTTAWSCGCRSSSRRTAARLLLALFGTLGYALTTRVDAAGGRRTDQRAPSTKTSAPSTSGAGSTSCLAVAVGGVLLSAAHDDGLDRPPAAARPAQGHVRAPAEAVAALLRQQRGRPRDVARHERRDVAPGPDDERLPDDRRRRRRHRAVDRLPAVLRL